MEYGNIGLKSVKPGKITSKEVIFHTPSLPPNYIKMLIPFIP